MRNNRKWYDGYINNVQTSWSRPFSCGKTCHSVILYCFYNSAHATDQTLFSFTFRGQVSMDLLPNEQNFDLDTSRQKCHHSLKEHHKISNIPKFRCEML